jgi:hypothetical protein
MTFYSDKFHDVSDRYASCDLKLAMSMEISHKVEPDQKVADPAERCNVSSQEIESGELLRAVQASAARQTRMDSHGKS